MADADRLNEAETMVDLSRAEDAVDAWDAYMEALDSGDTEARDRAFIVLSDAMSNLRRRIK